MRVLFLTHAFNSLAQRLFVEFREAGHEVSIEFDVNDRVTEEAVRLYSPDVVVAPMLKRAIPESIWRRHRCLIVHPGPIGDRGPSSLDWAIMSAEREWGVTVFEATDEMDAGPVWAHTTFPMRDAAKASLYRNEVTDAAVEAVMVAISRMGSGKGPLRSANVRDDGTAQARRAMLQAQRTIDWNRDDTASVLRKIRAADGAPGVRDAIGGVPYLLFGAHEERLLDMRAAPPGALIARRHGAICRATIDGAVWITHLRRADDPRALKLPSTTVLRGAAEDIPEIDAPLGAPVAAPTWHDIAYEERGAVGYLSFAFYNGAMSTTACERLREAYATALARPTRVIVLTGGPDFWSNGIDLNAIEAADHPAEESMRNIEAMDDLVRDIITTQRKLTIAALRGNAGAGGVFLALAADRVYARSSIVLNAHYKGMGNLYGSEYWTYLLPRRVRDDARRHALTESRLPLGAMRAAALGLVDTHFGESPRCFEQELCARAASLAGSPDFDALLRAKAAQRSADQAEKPLEAYREEELARMRLNFFGFDPSYHVARYNFVAKVPRSRTPLHLALHRRRTRTGDLASAP